MIWKNDEGVLVAVADQFTMYMITDEGLAVASSKGGLHSRNIAKRGRVEVLKKQARVDFKKRYAAPDAVNRTLEKIADLFGTDGIEELV